MKRTYLIDSENINDMWVDLLETMQEEDEILVFYTDKSAHMGYDKIVKLMNHTGGAIHWIKCFEGQNALDFQLVSELGCCLSQGEDREYVIVSNDTGYDAVVRYWTRKGFQVSRMRGVECERLRAAIQAEEKREEDQTEPQTGEAVVREAEQQTGEEEVQAAEPEFNPPYEFLELEEPEDGLKAAILESGSLNPEKDLEALKQLCKTLKLSNMSMVHNALEYVFGQNAGNAMYHFIKNNPGCRGELSAGYSNNKRQRERAYLELVLERSDLQLQDGDTDVIMRILNAIPRKNLNGIHTALVRKFGQEEGGRFYTVLRNHVKIIRGL